MKTIHPRYNDLFCILPAIILSLGGQAWCTADCVPPPLGLVSWWRAEGDASDAFGGNHGALLGNTSYGAGQVGDGFSFDGNGGGVWLGNPASLQLQNFTIEAWIRRASAAIVSFTENEAGLLAYGGGGYGFSIFNNGSLSLTKVGVNNVVLATGVLDTNWHHVAVTKTNGVVVFYVDAVAYPAPAYNPTFDFTSDIQIGSASAFTYGFYGSIDELAVFDRALAAPEIQAIYQVGSAGKCLGPPGPSLVIATQPANLTVGVGGAASFGVGVSGTPPFSFQWQHATTNLSGATNSSLVLTNVQPSAAGNYSVVVTNEAGSLTSSNALLTIATLSNCITAPSGLVSWWRAEGNALDASDGNSGVLAGNATYGTGRVGSAFMFDGNQDGVTLGNPANLQLQNFTIEAWIRRTSSSQVSLDPGGNAAGTFLAYGTSGYGFQIASDGRLALGKLGSSATIATGAGFTDLNWHHVAVTKSGSNVVFYRDGAVNSVASYDPGFGFTAPATIGGWSSSLANSFLGLVDEIGVYNRALGSNEIAAVYAASLDGKCLQLPPSIATQPANQTVGPGAAAMFAVALYGTPPFSYQWQHATTNLPGATNASLVLTNVRPSDAGNYSVRVTNAVGSVVSSNALLTVLPVGLLWSTNLGASLFAVDEQTNAYANVGGTVIKLNGAGVPLQTNNNICPRAQFARRDAAGNYYFTGTLPSHAPGGIFLVYDPLDFGGGVILSNLPIFLAKYSAAGSLLWATNFGPGFSLRSSYPTDLVLDGFGNVFVGYSYYSSTTDHDAAIGKCSSSGAVIWTTLLPKPSGNGAFGYARLGALSPTNGFGVHFTSIAGSFYAIALSTFDANGATATVASWNQNNSGAHLGTRPIRNSLGQIYNVEQSSILTKRTASGALISSNNTGTLKWTVGQDKWDGVHLTDSSGPLLRYDYDGNLVWSIPLASQVLCMELDTNGNRFISTANGMVARISDEPLAAPIITNNPVGTTVFTGTNVSLTVAASGTTPLRYYWFNGASAVAGGTNATLNLVNPTASQSGAYFVIVSNFVGSVTSTPVQVRIKAVQLYIGNQMLTNGTYVFASPPTLTIRSAFTNGSVYYSLDGSTPSFLSIPYNSGPFIVSSNATVRALGYSADFLQSEEADAVNLVLPPTYTLTAGTFGPGSVSLNPTGGVYIASTVVTATATPTAGWSFHHWSGDASGTSSNVNVAMTQNKNIQAVFATTLSTTVPSNGQVQPTGGVYPYGTVVRLSAIPQPGYYFGVWGFAASGNSNPLYFPITNANPTVSSLFAALPQGQAALTVLINGSGSVNVNPPGNKFATNQSVTLTAAQGFINWSGDASGTQNPLTVAMTQSRVITANFHNWPVLVANQQSFTAQGFSFSLLSGPGLTYQVQGSTDFNSWANLGVVTNNTGETLFTDPAATNLPLRFYRAISWP